MGKLLISDNQEWFDALKGVYEKTGFSVAWETNKIVAYQKMNVKNENCLCEGDNAVICVGTWAYRGSVGKKGLQKLFDDTINNYLKIEEVRRQLIGTYCTVIKIGSMVRVFVDETHTYSMYYAQTKDGFIVTNTYYHIQKYIHSAIDKNILHVSLAITGLSSNKTVFKDIKRLFENEIIEINLEKRSFNIVSCPLNDYSYDLSTKCKALNSLEDTITGVAKALNKNAKKKIIFATGGLDSRLKLALDCHMGYTKEDLHLAYWGGNNIITNGTENDRKINEMLAEKIGCGTEYIELTEKFKNAIESINVSEADRYGEYLKIYAHDRTWLGLFENIYRKAPEIEEIVLGYDPDVLREMTEIEAGYDKPYDLEKLIDAAFLRSGLVGRIFDEADDIKCWIKQDIHKTIQGMEQEDLSIAEAVNVFNYARLDMGSTLINFINQYYFCCNLMYTKPVWDIAWKVSYEYKKNSQLAIGLIERWKPDLLDIPVFSHHHFMIVKKGELLNTRKNAFLLWLRPKIINSKIYTVIWLNFFQSKFLRNLTEENDQSVLEQCIDYLKNDEIMTEFGLKVKENVVRKEFDLAALGTAVAYLKFCALCRIEREEENQAK